MKKEGYWVIRTYRSGDMGEKVKFFVPGKKPSSSARRMKADIRKAAQNEETAEKRANRILHKYFSHRDYLLTLEYSSEEWDGEFDDAILGKARHQAELWLRRVRRECQRQGIPFRCMVWTSDMDGETGEPERVHHHVIINAEACEIALGQWSLGYTYRKHIKRERDHMGLVHYLMAQVRRQPDTKKYTRTRNMPDVQPRDRVARGGSVLRAPKGSYLLYQGPVIPGWPQYIRYWIPTGGEEAEE